MAEVYALDDEDLPADAFPITYSNILKNQQKDKKLMQHFKSSCKLKFKDRRLFKLICNKENMIVTSNTLQLRAVQWYHNTLYHPGETYTELTTKLHFA